MNLVYTLLLLFSAVATLAQGQENGRTPFFMSSKAIFTGVDNPVSNASNIDNFHDPRNHVSAVASILYKLAENSNFNPKARGLQDVWMEFDYFQRNITRSKLFKMEWEADHSMSIGEERHYIKRTITNTYQPTPGSNITGADVANIMVDELIPKYTDPSRRYYQLTTILITIHGGDNSTVFFDLNWMTIWIDVKPNGLLFIPPGYTDYNQQTFQVPTANFTNLAAHYGNLYPKVSVNTLLDRFNTFNSTSVPGA